MEKDIVVEKLKKVGLPVTRENYLFFAYLGNPPEKLSAEEEAQLPRELQRWETYGRQSDPR
jgi:hypothetical protein